MAGPLASPGFVSHGSPIPLPSSSNRLPPRLRVALIITPFAATPPRRPHHIVYRNASASLCLAVARAPLPMHLVIHLVRQVESPPLPPEAADAEISSRVPVVVVVLRLLRPYLCVLASALAACAPLSVRPRLCILLYILFVKLKLPRSLPPEAADARPLYEILLLLLLCCGSCALTCASWPLHSRLLRPYPGVLAPVIVLLHRCCRPGVARRPGTNDGSIRAARLENEVVRCTAGALVAAATRCAPAAPPCEPVLIPRVTQLAATHPCTA